jgi:hypothetical protein
MKLDKLLKVSYYFAESLYLKIASFEIKQRLLLQNQIGAAGAVF